MAELRKGGLVGDHDQPIHGSCAIYFPHGLWLSFWVKNLLQFIPRFPHSLVVRLRHSPLIGGWRSCGQDFSGEGGPKRKGTVGSWWFKPWPFWGWLSGPFKGCLWPTQRLGMKMSRIESPGFCFFLWNFHGVSFFSFLSCTIGLEL